MQTPVLSATGTNVRNQGNELRALARCHLVLRVALQLGWGLHSEEGRELPAVKRCSRESASNVGLGSKEIPWSEKHLESTSPVRSPYIAHKVENMWQVQTELPFSEASAAHPPAQSRPLVCSRAPNAAAGRGSQKIPPCLL